MDGPLLIAANHPNSFLDAVIFDILFKKPIWSLTRGDVFKKAWHAKLLRRLKMLPIYRTSEGVQNLETNYTTFDECKNIFKKNGIVLMFSEGRCVNEWHLRPLKKGTARLAFSTWNEGIPLKILPVGINYSSFRRFGKNVIINFGSIITSELIVRQSEGKNYNAFNDLLKSELEKCVIEISPEDINAKKQELTIPVSFVYRSLLFVPAMIGLLLHAPVYLGLRSITINKLKDIEHYDSLLTAFLVFTYPFYLALIFVIAYALTGNVWSLILVFLLPITAWCCMYRSKQLDAISS